MVKSPEGFYLFEKERSCLFSINQEGDERRDSRGRYGMVGSMVIWLEQWVTPCTDIRRCRLMSKWIEMEGYNIRPDAMYQTKL